MAGLIDTPVEKNDPLSNVAGVEAQKLDVSQPTGTVEGRIQGLIAQNSPLAQSAVTRSKQAQQAKGLLNTSMAVGAGDRALYDYALPIASQDAAAVQRQAELNAAATNRASEFTAGARNVAESRAHNNANYLNRKLNSKPV